jgi:tetratricopeptide (TPR) repeat protein
MQFSKILGAIFLTLFATTTQAQNDSLWKVYQNKTLPDSVRLMAIDDLSWNMTTIDPDSAIELGKLERQLAQQSRLSSFEAKALNNIGVANMNRGNYPDAVEHYLLALKIYEARRDKRGIGTSYTNVGNIYREQKEHEKALDYYSRALQIFIEIGHQQGIAACYSNIGIVHFNSRSFEKAFENFNKALAKNKEIGDVYSESKDYLNIANYYLAKDDFVKSRENFEKSMLIAQNIGFVPGIAFCFGNLAVLDAKLGNYRQALTNSDSAIYYASMAGMIDVQRGAYEVRAQSFAALGNYKEAFENHTKFKQLHDSIFSEENSRQLGDLRTQYEVEKKEAELKTKAEAQAAITAEEKKRQRIVMIFLGLGLLIVAVFSMLLYKRFRLTRKQKEIIEVQSRETTFQKHLIEEKQKEIIDSITYAKRLQQAILPPADFIRSHQKETMIYYRPKDLVAGDFYWAESLNGKFFIAAADSTGHGVPGAMVSIICSTALSRAVKEFGISETGPILDKARELVIQTFEKSQSAVNDGMDISLLCIDPGKRSITWSGANNPLWYFSQNAEGYTMSEIKADKQPIGRTDRATPFSTHQVPYMEGNVYFLFTDGFADQFGGENGKKLKYKPFAQMLQDVCHGDLTSKDAELNKRFEAWAGDLEQVDDVCVIGIRI